MALVSLLSAVTGGRDQVEDGCFFLIDDLAFGHPAVRDSVVDQLGSWLNRGRRSGYPDATRVRRP